MCRYAPLMREAGNWWRWLSSLVVQDSFPHLLATALLYGALSLHVEHRYGTRRTVLLTVTAAVAGNFLDTLIMVSGVQASLQLRDSPAGHVSTSSILLRQRFAALHLVSRFTTLPPIDHAERLACSLVLTS